MSTLTQLEMNAVKGRLSVKVSYLDDDCDEFVTFDEDYDLVEVVKSPQSLIEWLKWECSARSLNHTHHGFVDGACCRLLKDWGLSNIAY